MTAPIITLTEAAAARVRSLLAASDSGAGGLRLAVNEQGCSGLAYSFDFAAAPGPDDEVVAEKGVRIFIDPKAVEYVSGAEMDFVEDTFTTGFVFQNPNEKGRCGCGESFYV